MGSLQRNDKQIERDRYNERARQALGGVGGACFGEDGARALPIELRAPYTLYESLIASHVQPGAAVLDLCCGNGLYSLTAARCGASVTASDIAEENLELVRLRAARAGVGIVTVVADAERLPFPDLSFDLVTCAGSLSYVDLDLFLGEVTRVLRPRGGFIVYGQLKLPTDGW